MVRPWLYHYLLNGEEILKGRIDEFFRESPPSRYADSGNQKPFSFAGRINVAFLVQNMEQNDPTAVSLTKEFSGKEGNVR